MSGTRAWCLFDGLNVIDGLDVNDLLVSSRTGWLARWVWSFRIVKQYGGGHPTSALRAIDFGLLIASCDCNITTSVYNCRIKICNVSAKKTVQHAQ